MSTYWNAARQRYENFEQGVMNTLRSVGDKLEAAAESGDITVIAKGAVRYDAAMELEAAEQAQARGNISAADGKALEAIFAPVEYWDADTAQTINGRRVRRENGYEYTVTGTSEGGVSTGGSFHRLSGPLVVSSSANTMLGWSCNLELESGVPYTMTVIPVSGSASNAGSVDNFYLIIRDEDNVVRVRINLDGTMQTAHFYWPNSTLKGKIILRTQASAVTPDFKFRLILARDMNAVPEGMNLAETVPVVSNATLHTGDLRVMQGQLYKVTQDIAPGDTITPGVNVTETSVAALLAALETRIAALEA